MGGTNYKTYNTDGTGQTIIIMIPLIIQHLTIRLLNTISLMLVLAAKLHYGTSLSNVDWLHGGAESLLTLTNLLIVLGLREALRKLKDGSKKSTPDQITSDTKEKSLSR